MRDINSFVADVLALPAESMRVKILNKLIELYPDKHIFVTDCSSFDVDGFLRYAHAEGCYSDHLNPLIALFPALSPESVRQKMQTGSISLNWRGHEFVVLRLPNRYCHSHFVVGDSEQAVLDFFCAVTNATRPRNGAVMTHSSGYWMPDEEMRLSIEKASFDSLVFDPKFITDLRHQVDSFFESSEVYERYGMQHKRGLLFEGPPGNGKSCAVKALIAPLKVPKLFIKNFRDAYDDEGCGVDAVFERVRQLAPCVVIMEDVDSLIHRSFLSSVLNQLDGVKPLNGVFIIGTTNYPTKLDPAIRHRPSRFDRIVRFGPPQAPERKRYLMAHVDGQHADMAVTDEDMDKLVVKTEGFSYAYLKELVVSANVKWFSQREPGSMYKQLRDTAKLLRLQMNPAVARNVQPWA